MNVLLLTDLYPSDAGHSRSEISYALHDFARQWALTENVQVLRPFIVPDWHQRNRPVPSGAFFFDGVKISHAPVWKIPWLRVFCLAGLRRHLRASGFQPEVIVAHLGFNLLFAHRLAKAMHLPLIAAVHLGDLLHSPVMLGAKRLRAIYEQAAGIACRSPVILQRFTEKHPALRKSCFVAYSGIDSSWFQADAEESGRFIGWPQKRPIVFCTVASLLPCKCIDVNLRALARLPAEIEWRYKIIGDGPQKHSLEKLASSLAIADRVTFMGFLPQVLSRRELLSSHVFLMISRDTFGLAYLEAMASGLLVVGSRGFGIDGILVDGENGFLCVPENVVELAAILCRLTAEMNGEEVRLILANARKTVSQFTMEKAAAHYLENIKRAIRAGQNP